MKPRQILEYKNIKFPFGGAKVINAGRYLRAMGLYKSGKEKEPQVTINEFVILLYSLSADITEATAKNTISNLVNLKSKNGDPFFDRMVEIFSNQALKGVNKIEISSGWPFAHIYHDSGQIEEYFYPDQDYKSLVHQVTILPRPYLEKVIFDIHQTTDIGMQLSNEYDYQKMIDEDVEATKKIFIKAPSIEDIKKAIGVK
jgi:hypothetical protein